MADFLLELFSEEIPARMQAKACADLERLFIDALAAAGLRAEAVQTQATPRRLSLIAQGLPLETAATSEERRGPRTDAPEQALAGFLKSTGLTREQLVERDDPKGRFLYAVIERPGRRTADVLAEALPALIRSFPWPKSMRWGEASQSTASMRWVRPLKAIVALLDGEVVPFEVEAIMAGAQTRGHRFHHPDTITIANAGGYAAQLRDAHVILDPKERQQIIAGRAAELAGAAGLAVVPDEGLLAENAGLTEWPVPLLGSFDPAFLVVPREVIQLTMRTNQKYFALTEASTGNLAPNFICVANIAARDEGRAITAGNEKVLAARLSDARFFWEQDKKTRLADFAARLGQIVFHEKLGAIADKVDRVARLARWLAEEGIVPGADPIFVEQAARLAKADLLTGMVGEFPELQGVMGGYYAQAEGLPDDVAHAIRDHYKPVGQGDEVPTAPVTVAVSLADKLDTLTSFFAIGEMPTGSKDPFALRRAALAVIALLINNDLRLKLDRLCAFLQLTDETARALTDFFADRLKVQQREAGVRHDLIDAVFVLGGEDDLVRLLARVKALQAFVSTEDGANLLAGYKRAANILRIEEKKGGLDAQGDYTREPAETALIAALDPATAKAVSAVAAERFEEAMAALATLRQPIDAFFDKVTVNDSRPEVRAERLRLLDRIRAAVHKVADFSQIEG